MFRAIFCPSSGAETCWVDWNINKPLLLHLVGLLHYLYQWRKVKQTPNFHTLPFRVRLQHKPHFVHKFSSLKNATATFNFQRSCWYGLTIWSRSKTYSRCLQTKTKISLTKTTNSMLSLLFLVRKNNYTIKHSLKYSCDFPFAPIHGTTVGCLALRQPSNLCLSGWEVSKMLGSVLMKVKVTFTLEKATKAQRGEQRFYSFFNLDARWGGWSTPRPGRSTPGKIRYPLHRRLSGPQGRSGEVLKISPPHTGIRSPDRPARNESLYQLSYPGPGSVLTADNKWQYNGFKMLLRAAVAIQRCG